MAAWVIAIISACMILLIMSRRFSAGICLPAGRCESLPALASTTIATSFCCVGACRGKSTASARWLAGSFEAANENSQNWGAHLHSADRCLLLAACVGARKCEPGKREKIERRNYVLRNRESARKSARQTESARKGSRRCCRGPHFVRTALRGMSWR